MTISDRLIYNKLREQFGFQEFRPGQLEILHKLLAGQSTLAILPTGAGKTLIYQMYGLLCPGTVVVVSPLLSLIKDQIQRLRLSGERQIAELTSQVAYTDQRYVLNHLADYKFIFLSPESLQKPEVQARINQLKIALMVVDEAHCIVQWGKSFRPDYLRIGQVRKQFGNPLTLALTATASQNTRLEILRYLALDAQTTEQYVASVDRKNIFLDFLTTDSVGDKEELLLNLIDELPGAGIVYFSSRKVASQVSELINRQLECSAAPYHAGMSTYDRLQVQSQFQKNQLDVICATSAFGMGIDKADIRYVIHYHMPGDIESYVQEIGRAGRDGQPSVAITLYAAGDEMIPSVLISYSLPNVEEQSLISADQQTEEQRALIEYYREFGLSEAQLKSLFKKQAQQKEQQILEMLKLIRTTGCHRRFLLQHFDEQFTAHDDQCCGSINDFTALGLQPPRDASQLAMADWRVKLAQIFATE
ncbi:RecQ family ATP-dependent DNA helicase [Pediococcus acidilactici]